MTPRRISFQTATEMRHLRYTEHLTCAQIAQRFGVSVNAVSLHTKLSKPKPASLHERWTLLLPTIIAEVKKAAGPPPTPSPYPAAAKALDKLKPPSPEPELHFGDHELEPA